jgi:hypothetical protein
MPKLSFEAKKVGISLNEVLEIFNKSQELKLFMLKLQTANIMVKT